MLKPRNTEQSSQHKFWTKGFVPLSENLFVNQNFFYGINQFSFKKYKLVKLNTQKNITHVFPSEKLSH